MEWQPIETAPKDGTHVLLYRSGEYASLHEGYWKLSHFGGSHAWGGAGWTFAGFDQPTHWMPLPAPPGDIPEEVQQEAAAK